LCMNNAKKNCLQTDIISKLIDFPLKIDMKPRSRSKKQENQFLKYIF